MRYDARGNARVTVRLRSSSRPRRIDVLRRPRNSGSASAIRDSKGWWLGRESESPDNFMIWRAVQPLC